MHDERGAPRCLRAILPTLIFLPSPPQFRKYLNLKQFETFEEWNTDPKVAAAVRLLVFFGLVWRFETLTILRRRRGNFTVTSTTWSS